MLGLFRNIFEHKNQDIFCTPKNILDLKYPYSFDGYSYILCVLTATFKNYYKGIIKNLELIYVVYEDEIYENIHMK